MFPNILSLYLVECTGVETKMYFTLRDVDADHDSLSVELKDKIKNRTGRSVATSKDQSRENEK
jgi:hypothetical protein